MSLYSDKVLLLNLVAATTSSSGPWVDLSGYQHGVLFVVTTAFSGTSWTPAAAVNTSPDNGAHSLALPGTEWAAAWAAISTAPNTQRAVIPVPQGVLNLGWIQVPYTITAATVTANMYFVGHV